MNLTTDEYLVKDIQKNKSNNSLKELISRHSGIYVEMIRRYGQKYLTSTQIDDLMGDKDFNIYSAALDYNGEKSKFSTYLANRTRYHCLSNKTINKKNSNIVNFDDIEFEQESKEQNPCQASIQRESMKKICFLIEGHEDPRVVRIFKERYFSGDTKKLKPWKVISEEIGLSIQGCIDIHTRAVKQFKKKISNDAITF